MSTAAPVVDSDPTQPPLSPAAAAQCDVLIADDNGPSRQVLAAILRNFVGALQIHEVRSGDEAVRRWPELRPRITLLDLDMPGLSGLQALQAIRGLAPEAFVGIVSGSSSADNVRQALQAGARAFVVKPYKPQRILDVVGRYEQLSGTSLGNGALLASPPVPPAAPPATAVQPPSTS
jgi:CheY-like chemotaxis protein